MVGKDILRFHAVYWPAFLMAADVAPPKRVFAHGWWTNEGRKISKSLGNVIDPYDLVERYGHDQVRYFMLREVPFGNDGDFSHTAVMNRANGDLANDFGNLSQRVLSMINKNCDAQVPQPGTLTEEDTALIEGAEGLLPVLRRHFETQAFHQALAALWGQIQAANRYVDMAAPWKLRKEDPQRMHTVLWVLAEVIRHYAILAQPITPRAAGRILDQLAVPEDARGFDRLGEAGRLRAGTPLPKPEGVFPRLQDETDS